MIDRRTGDITLSATCKLKAGDEFYSVSTLLSDTNQEVVDKRNGWTWLTCRNVEVAEAYIVISLGFCADALKQVELIVAKDRFDLAEGWDDWSEQHELNLLNELRIWLSNELGREGKFPWGEAQAAYDPRGGYSAIHIRYH